MQKREKGQKLRENEISCCSQCFYCTQLFKKHAGKCISISNTPLNLLSKREETEEEDMVDMDDGGSEIEESERTSVDIDNILDPDGAPAHRILCLEVTQRPPVVIRFGRVVTVGCLEK